MHCYAYTSVAKQCSGHLHTASISSMIARFLVTKTCHFSAVVHGSRRCLLFQSTALCAQDRQCLLMLIPLTAHVNFLQSPGPASEPSLMVVRPDPLQLLHGLVPHPFAPISYRPPERFDKVLVLLMTVVDQRDNVVGCVGDPWHGKDLELVILLPQPCVEFSRTVKACILNLVDIPEGDFAIECIQVNEEAGVSLCQETMIS